MRIAAVDAPRRVEAPVEMNHFLAASTLMQIINVLSDDCQFRNVLGKFCYREVCFIRLRLKNLFPTPFIPAPAETWIYPERFGGRQLDRIESLPKTR
jgi:hypothetical protein